MEKFYGFELEKNYLDKKVGDYIFCDSDNFKSAVKGGYTKSFEEQVMNSDNSYTVYHNKPEVLVDFKIEDSSDDLRS